jgi:hypothetical protein
MRSTCAGRSWLQFDSSEEGFYFATFSLEFHARLLFMITWTSLAWASHSLSLLTRLNLFLAHLNFSFFLPRSWGCRLPPKMHPKLDVYNDLSFKYSSLSITTQNDSRVSGSAENAPYDKFNLTQLDFKKQVNYKRTICKLQ